MVRESTEMERSIGSNPRRQSIPAERPATSDRTTVDKNEPLPKNSLPFPALSFRVELGRGRGISNLDKKARITRPAPLI